MALSDLISAAITSGGEPGPKPRDDELDLFGMTHTGKVRTENQDHFLMCTVHQQLVVHYTSFPDPGKLPVRGERFASILLVADGVGGATAGREASQLTIETIARYVSSTMRCFQGTVGPTSEEQLLESLRAAAREAHAAVRAEAAGRGASKMATTLTLAIQVWPYSYVMQVGDSRAYYYVNDNLRLVTRDQTLAQDLVDQGVLPADRVSRSPFRHVLARAIGADEATPEVTRIGLNWGCVLLLCSDGLTKHVSDGEILSEIRAMTSSEQLCRSLVDLALERGGSDNVTVLAGRPIQKRPTG
ncbi:MAG TPA: protein phosphatase 2C domain-containing protein [Gemmatimonadaceae bacterium]|nr:protein phosphatase 2C domain-containing protein [Gemmatimonadaceae bacterium]